VSGIARVGNGRNRIYAGALLLIIIAGACMRFFHIGRESIWCDEGFSLYSASNILDFLGSPARLYAGYFELHPPLYFIILHFWIKLFGTSEGALRTPTTIAGIISLYMIFLLGKALYDKKTGIIASLILMVSLYDIFNVCQEARPYAFLNLFTLCSYYYLWKATEEGGLKNLILYGLFTIMLIYTHYYGAFIILAQNIYVAVFLFFRGSRSSDYLDWKKWLLCQGAIALAFMPWIGFLLYHLAHQQREHWQKTPTIIAIYKSSLIFANLSLPLLIMGCLLAILSINFMKTSREEMKQDPAGIAHGLSWRDIISGNRPFVMLSLWCLVVMLLPFFFSLLVVPIYFFRYVVPASLAFYLLVARGISLIQSRYVTAVIIAIIMTLSINAIIPFYLNPRKEQWREMVKAIEHAAEPGDLVLVCHGILLKHCYEHYATRRDLETKPFPRRSVNMASNSAIIDEKDIPELKEAVKDHHDVWLVLTHYEDPGDLVRKTLLQDFKIQVIRNFYEMKVILLERREKRKLPGKNLRPGRKE
jgi:mannosyltransferase